MIYSNLTFLSMLTAKKPLNHSCPGKQTVPSFVSQQTVASATSIRLSQRKKSDSSSLILAFIIDGYLWLVLPCRGFLNLALKNTLARVKYVCVALGFIAQSRYLSLPCTSWLYQGDFCCSFTKPGTAFCSLL